jgi:hypothetical protein
VEIGEKLDRLTVPSVYRNMATFKVGKTFLQNPFRKTLHGLCKVVEGSKTYNFPIHHLVHFYSTFWSFSFSNRASRINNRGTATSRRRDADRAPARAVLRGAASLGVRARVVPRMRAPRRLGARSRRVSCPHPSTGRRAASTGPSGVSPYARTPAEAGPVPAT